MAKHVLVIGGTGRTGRIIVEKLQEAGMTPRVLTRNLARLRSQGIEGTSGDITNAADVAHALHGVDGVIIVVEPGTADQGANSPRAVHFQGMQHILAAATPGTQIVLVSQIYITRPERFPEVRNIIHWRGEAEQALRQSAFPYTIVRPAWLTHEVASSSGIALEQGDRGEGQISREAVAEVCAQALVQKQAQGKTFEVYARSGITTADWSERFAQLQLDQH